MRRRALIGELCAGAAVLAALSCARLGYELLPGASSDPLPDDTNVPRDGLGGSGAHDAGAVGAGGVSGRGGAAASGSGGTGSSTDAGDGGVADAGVSTGGPGGGTLPGCAPAAPVATWAFASAPQGWEVEADPGATGNLSWTGATGDPAPGALEIDATVANGIDNVRVYLDQSPSDLTTRVIYARVLLESGTSLSAKVFVQSGAGAWGDGDEVFLVPGAWQCVSLDLQDFAIVTPGFDSTAVRTLGVFFFGDASAHLYIDQISY